MTLMKCSGRDAISGERIVIEFDDVIQHLNPAFSDEIADDECQDGPTERQCEDGHRQGARYNRQ